jgi:beta-ribofuranosylaminobenzene 5'-phosphate synthase
MTRVTAGTRLHFGLICPTEPEADFWPSSDPTLTPRPVRRFGGVGIGLSEPRIVVEVQRAHNWSASGPSKDRALDAARRSLSYFDPIPDACFHVDVLQCPPEHTGLGVGTALTMAVGAAVVSECGEEELRYERLAVVLGRGLRSAVGLNLFRDGNFVIDAGKTATEEVGRLAACIPVPSSWRVLCVRPNLPPRWFGVEEKRAFANAPKWPLSKIERLSRIALLDLAPTLWDANFAMFSEALYEFNRIAGEAFATVQGGPYADPQIGAIIAELRTLGCAGVGQSSWGPTIFALCESAEQAEELRRCLQATEAGREAPSEVATPSRIGARVETQDGA